MHRLLLISIVSMVCIAALLIIVQIWAPIISWDIFIKLLLTLGVLTLLAALLMIFRADFAEHKKLKDENYLD